MALLPRLRRLLRRPVSSSRVGTRRETPHARRGDTVHEDALRSQLSDDPNNEEAFRALAELVRRRASESYGDQDPLTAPGAEQEIAAERQRAADLAVWSLAEELAGHPKAWYPLVALARLAMDDDEEGAVRRLGTAAERDPSGRALAAGIALLRERGRAAEALNLGVGHWHSRDHDPEVARQLVLAALESGRPMEARQYVGALADHPDREAARAVRQDLEEAVARAEQSVREA